MATYNLINKTSASTGQKIIALGNNNDVRLKNLEDKVGEQSDKLDQITSLLKCNIRKDISFLKIISEYKSDNTALKKQIDDLKKQLDDAQSRIKRLLIRCEQFAEDNNTKEE